MAHPARNRFLLSMPMHPIHFFLGYLAYSLVATIIPIPILGQEKPAHSLTTRLSNLLDPVQRSFKLWKHGQHLQSSVPIVTLIGFLKNSPHWPHTHVIRRTIEKRIFADPSLLAPDAAFTFFKQFPPLSFEGILGYGRTLRSMHKLQGPLLLKPIRKAWHTFAMTPLQEEQFLLSMKGWIRDEDHTIRCKEALWNKDTKRAEKALTYVTQKDFLFLSICLAWLKGEKTRALSLEKRLSHQDTKKDIFLWAKVHGIRKTNEGPFMGCTFFLGEVAPHITWERRAAWWQLQRSLAQALFFHGHGKQAFLVLKAGPPLLKKEQQAEQALSLGVYALLSNHDIPTAIAYLVDASTMTTSNRRYAKACYWVGYAYKKLGHAAEEVYWYQKAASKPTTFYGQQARYALKKPIEIFWKRLPLAMPHLRPSDPKDALLLDVFYYLCRKEKPNEATIRHFLRAIWKVRTLGLYHLSSLSVASHSFPHISAFFLEGSRKTSNTIYQESFPLFTRYHPIIKGREAPLALVLSIIHTESLFDPYARGGCGEFGLMQLMPKTARQEAISIGYPTLDDEALLKAEINITLGANHIARLLKQFNGDLSCAIAAYNGGATMATKWKKSLPKTLSTASFKAIERIPYPGTRDYVQKVLAAAAVYQLRLGRLE